MKVSELINKLQALDGNLEVYCYTEDEKFATPKAAFHLLDPSLVSVGKGVLSRGPTGEPLISWDNEAGRPLAIIEVSADF